MPTLEQNIQRWNRDYQWSQQGDEWSQSWGGPDMQWHGTFLPRLHCFLPASAMLEIAPGYGRWTMFLKQFCQKFIGVDLSSLCVDYCKKRFAGDNKMEFHVNDGRSLEMVADQSIDLIISLDSLVHVEAEIMEAYLSQFPRILNENGIAVIHHSNFASLLPPEAPPAAPGFGLPGEPENRHWRARTMSGDIFIELCKKHGLTCITQERLAWGCNLLNDCFSVLTPKGSNKERDTLILENPQFMAEASNTQKLSPYYSWARYGRPDKEVM
jgi:SAM-dependent methyltransferase